MAIEIDSLELNISASGESAAAGLDALLSKLNEIKSVASGGLGLDKVSKELNSIGNGLKKIAEIDTSGFGQKLTDIFGAFSQLSVNVSGLKDISTLTRSLRAITALDIGGFESNMQRIRLAFLDLTDVVNGFDSSNLQALATLRSYSRVTATAASAAKELSGEMQEVGTDAETSATGFAKLNGNIVDIFKKMDDGAKAIRGSVGATIKSFFKSVLRIALYRAVRSALKAIVAGLKEGINNAYQFSKAMDTAFSKKMDEAAASFQYFKNSIGAIGVQLLQVFLPAIMQLADGLAAFNNALAEIIAAGAGQSTYMKATKSAKEYAEAVNAAKNATLGFDELNIIQNQSSIADMFEELAVSADAIDIAAELKNKIKVISGIVGAALLAVGVAALVMGFPRLGIGLMLAGAVGIGTSVAMASNEGDTIKKVQQAVEAIVGITAGIALVAGAILCVTGNIPLGVGFLLYGFAGAITEVAWAASGNATDKVKEVVGDIMGIGGTLLVALGALVALVPASMGLGIGMIIAGAKQLGWAAATFDTSTITQTIYSTVDKIANYIKTNIFDKIENFFTTTLPEWFNSLPDKIGGWFTGAWEKITGKTGVSLSATNEFITPSVGAIATSFDNSATGDGISQAIIAGVLAAMGEQGAFAGSSAQDQNITINVELDGRTIATSVQRIQHDNGVRIGTNGIVTA